MRYLLGLLAILTLGCQPVPKPGATAEPTNQPVAEGQPTPGGGGESIRPMTSAPIATAPVSGSESLQGGGSAAGQMMKDKARQVGGSSSVQQLPADGE